MLLAATLATVTVAFNTSAFDRASPIAFATVRMLVAGLGFAVLARRLGERALVRPDGPMLAWAASLVLQNAAVYLALDRVDLGVAVTLQMLGPIGLAAVLARRRADLLWALVALGGVVLLARPWGSADAPDAIGVGLCMLGAIGWALYILAARASRGRPGGDAGRPATGSAIGFAMSLPLFIAVGGFPVLDPVPVAAVLASGLLGAAVPWAIDLRVLRRLSPRTFGVLQSLYPVLSVLVGMVVLSQVPGLLDLAGMALAIVASIAVMARAAED